MTAQSWARKRSSAMVSSSRSSPPRLSRAHLDAALTQVRLRLLYGVLTVVEDARREGRIRVAEALGQVLEGPHATRGDDRDRDGGADPLQELQIVTGARAVPVHAGEEDLSRPAARDLHRPRDALDAGRARAAGDVDLPLLGIGVRPPLH